MKPRKAKARASVEHKASGASTPRCSFCNREQSAELAVVAGPNNVFICRECVDLYKAALTRDDSAPGTITE